MHDAPRPRHIAHRGGSLEVPENTLRAFRHAVEQGADMLEMDLRATADEEVVVLHDPDVDRVTGASGPVWALTRADLAGLSAAHWFVPGRGAVRDGGPYPLRDDGAVAKDLRIPTLEEVLRTFPGVPLTIDLKVGAPEVPWFHEAVASLLAEHARTDDVIVGSFSTERLAAFRRCAPRVPTSAAQEEVASFWAGEELVIDGRLVALQVPATFGDIEVVSADFVDRAHAAGLEVHVWVVDEAAEMRRLIALGVDGIITDRPRDAARVLGSLRA